MTYLEEQVNGRADLGAPGIGAQAPRQLPAARHLAVIPHDPSLGVIDWPKADSARLKSDETADPSASRRRCRQRIASAAQIPAADDPDGHK